MVGPHGKGPHTHSKSTGQVGTTPCSLTSLSWEGSQGADGLRFVGYEWGIQDLWAWCMMHKYSMLEPEQKPWRVTGQSQTVFPWVCSGIRCHRGWWASQWRSHGVRQLPCMSPTALNSPCTLHKLIKSFLDDIFILCLWMPEMTNSIKLLPAGDSFC